jgi:hypothetical protein
MYDPNAIATLAQWMPVLGIAGLAAFAVLLWWIFVS